MKWSIAALAFLCLTVLILWLLIYREYRKAHPSAGTVNTLDVRDWTVLTLVNGLWIAATVFLFKHPDTSNFQTWGALCVTMTGTYHWLVLYDSKHADRCGQP